MSGAQVITVTVGILIAALALVGATSVIGGDSSELLLEDDRVTIQEESSEAVFRALNNQDSSQDYQATVTSPDTNIVTVEGGESTTVGLGSSNSGLETRQESVTLEKQTEGYNVDIDVEIELYEKGTTEDEFSEEPVDNAHLEVTVLE